MKIITILIALFLTFACTSDPVKETPLTIRSTTPVVSFETSKNDQQRARDLGKPVLLKGLAAQYPSNAKPNELGHGWVQLDIEVLANGQVGEVIILDSADPLFNQPAIKAVRSWQFEPYTHARRLVHRIFIRGTQADHYQPSTETH